MGDASSSSPSTAAAATVKLCGHGHDQDGGKDKTASGAAEKNGALICYGEQDGKTETMDAAAAGEVTTIGVPAATACMH
uniref:Uncharacterized protein n=1 Tax=Oryza punctata TaxID=4537 RepID=A0A0E0MI21_ORYPU